MSSNDPNSNNSNLPPLQYPQNLKGAVPDALEEAIRIIYQNLFFLRTRTSALTSSSAVSSSEIKQILNQITINPAGPSTIGPTILVGTHLQRLTNYPSSDYPVGTIFFEADRNSIYINSDYPAILQWTYAAGVFESTLASIPTDLGTADLGFTFVSTDTTDRTEYIWNGTTFITFGGLQQIVADAVTNTITTIFKLIHITSGAAAAGFGAQELIQLENAAGTQVDAAAVGYVWTNAGAGTETSDFLISLRSAGAALLEKLRLIASGSLKIANDYLWYSATNFLGTLSHNNTADRTYTYADASGNMVMSGAALTAHELTIGDDGVEKIKSLGSTGTTTTVLHGNAGGDPSFAPVDLTNDVTSVLNIANGGTSANTPAAALANLGGLAANGVSGSVTLAKITGGGANGSITYVDGQITAVVAPT